MTTAKACDDRPTRRFSPARAAAERDTDAAYLRQWMTHQAVLYNDLLRNIAAAPVPHLPRRVGRGPSWN